MAVRTSKFVAISAAVVLAITLLILALCRPGPEAHWTVTTPVLPADLDDYIKDSETRFPDLRPETEKQIIWADPTHRVRTPLAVIYLHGFSASRQETRPLCDTLAAELGANLFYTRFRGHGRSDDAMGQAVVRDWLDDAAEALAIGYRIGERVVVVGSSTGATLGTWLVTRADADRIQALVLLSPNFGLKDRSSELLTWPFGLLIARVVIGSHRAWTPVNELQARYWTTRYPIEALGEMMQLVERVRQADFGKIELPVLMIYSERDQVVDTAATKRRYRELGSARKHLVVIDNVQDPQQHVLAGAVLSPDTTAVVRGHILDFVAEVR